MTTNQDIMAFLKKTEEDREREKEEDSKAREIERKEDMQRILEIISIVVQKVVNSVLKPLEERLVIQEKANMGMSRQFNTIKEELQALKNGINRQEFPPLPEHSEHGVARSGQAVVTPRVLDMAGTIRSSEEYSEAALGEIKQMCADARRVIGLTQISPRMLELQVKSYGDRDLEEAMLMEVV